MESGNESPVSSQQNGTKFEILVDEQTDIDDIPSTSIPIPVRARKNLRGRSFVRPLEPDDVRWFHKERDSKQWTPFNGYDSLRIELKWRSWSQTAFSAEFSELAEEVSQRDVVVLGGLYRLVLEEKQLRPLFWKGSAIHGTDALWVVRGTWFFTEEPWQPIGTEYSQEIEAMHLSMFTGQRIPENSVFFAKETKPLLAQKKLDDCVVVWNSVIDVSLRKGNRFSLVKSSYMINRGYKEAACATDRGKDVDHLIFVVHGIGQKNSVEHIAMNTIKMQTATDSMLSKELPDLAGRPLFLPVEWRSKLKLDGDLVTSITLSDVGTLRSLVNSTAMDIMYYTSPLFRTEITEGLTAEINRLYQLFVHFHPEFEESHGQVSIFAHSLGSVIIYDVLTRYSPLSLYNEFLTVQLENALQNTKDEKSYDHLKRLNDARKELENSEGGFLSIFASFPQLDFKVANLFCVGSPLGVFLAMRGLTGSAIISTSSGDELNFFNIFHPCDPVAYRIEPLVEIAYELICPVSIFRWDSTINETYNSTKLDLVDLATRRSLKLLGSVHTDLNLLKDSSSSKVDKKREKAERNGGPSSNSSFWSRLTGSKELACESLESDEDSGSASGKECATSLDEVLPVGRRLKRRIDYVLQLGNFESTYLAAVVSHVSYWTSNDVLMFVLQQTYKGAEDEVAEVAREAD